VFLAGLPAVKLQERINLEQGLTNFYSTAVSASFLGALSLAPEYQNALSATLLKIKRRSEERG